MKTVEKLPGNTDTAATITQSSTTRMALGRFTYWLTFCSQVHFPVSQSLWRCAHAIGRTRSRGRHRFLTTRVAMANKLKSSSV